MTEILLTHAILVLPGETLSGTLVLRDGVIADMQPGRSSVAAAIDCGGDHLIPGIVDLHTDNLERQVEPRSRARWPSRSALLAHDAHCAAAGVTTVFDALCLGDLGFDESRIQTCVDGVADLDALAPLGALRAEHFLHLRCEVPAADMPAMLDRFADHRLVRIASLMDHTPGVGQYRDIARYRAMRLRTSAMDAAAIDTQIARLQAQRERLGPTQRRWLLERLRTREVPLASHDDDSAERVRGNAADGIRISEFPVVADAAAAARALGLGVIAGAPNIVRGGSHSGNVAAADLVRAGTVDALASDYVPNALVEAAWRLAAEGLATLPAAVAMVTAAPAAMVALHDRGALAVGLRADVVRVATLAGLPVVRRVWRGGAVVA